MKFARFYNSYLAFRIVFWARNVATGNKGGYNSSNNNNIFSNNTR